MQVLYALALDPVSETTADAKSFGFRKGCSSAAVSGNLSGLLHPAVEVLPFISLPPFLAMKPFGFRKGRSAHDACEYIFTALSRKTSPQWVLEGDIRGCFDHISHDWLIEHIPMDKSVLKQFLKAGFIFRDELFPTEEGTPPPMRRAFWKRGFSTIPYQYPAYFYPC